MIELGSECRLYHGDCLDVMGGMEAGSVDAILTDLPYGTTACSWDVVIPFEPMWAGAKHVLKPNGVFVTTASQPFTSMLVMSNWEWFKHEWIWNKRIPGNFVNVKHAPLKYHENIIVFCEASPTYNPQYRKDVLKPWSIKKGKSNHIDIEMTQKRGVGYPKSIIEGYPRPNHLTGGCLHDTQKPVALYEYLIRTYTDAGDTVLDIAMGSGTTGVACHKTGRRFIRIEKKQEYFEIARRRIEKARLQTVMNL